MDVPGSKLCKKSSCQKEYFHKDEVLFVQLLVSKDKWLFFFYEFFFAREINIFSNSWQRHEDSHQVFGVSYIHSPSPPATQASKPAHS